mmetsp:Transcript_27730/g.79642  ORF Transcript_27730/g.79642 Transcript_27730/m.79642 type:complete len:229 (+) Transcript_27730:320-1006(+)
MLILACCKSFAQELPDPPRNGPVCYTTVFLCLVQSALRHYNFAIIAVWTTVSEDQLSGVVMLPVVVRKPLQTQLMQSFFQSCTAFSFLCLCHGPWHASAIVINHQSSVEPQARTVKRLCPQLVIAGSADLEESLEQCGVAVDARRAGGIGDLLDRALPCWLHAGKVGQIVAVRAVKLSHRETGPRLLHEAAQVLFCLVRDRQHSIQAPCHERCLELPLIKNRQEAAPV